MKLTSSVTRSEDKDGTRTFHAVESSIADELRRILRRAELLGFVITNRSRWATIGWSGM